MSEKIIVPTLGESITEATVSKWLKNQGEKVSADEPIVELETDKVNVEVPAPSNGFLESISVNIYEIEPVNGLAAPDGKIFITRGFYNKFTSGEVTGNELASVIAHELGHVALGHSRRRMIDFSGQNALRVALGSILSRIIPGLGGIIANVLSNLLMARLSRTDEFEADEYASALMMKSGIGVEHQISMFEKLEKLSGNNANLQPAWLLSHPKTKKRIEKIQENLLKWNAN